MIDITTSDGKYRYVQQADGKVVIYRNGELWFSSGVEHNNMLRAFVQDLADVRRALSQPVTNPTEPANGQVETETIRICPERDARCPHGMSCPYNVDRWRCDIQASRDAIRAAAAVKGK